MNPPTAPPLPTTPRGERWFRWLMNRLGLTSGYCRYPEGHDGPCEAE